MFRCCVIEFEGNSQHFSRIDITSISFKSSHVISTNEVELELNLSYSEESIKILAREIKELKNKHIALVNVLWQHHGVEEATWELEEAMKL
ncbi:receptor-like protein kinase [Gossypium australe]|uniref:Receptor-like protein kinase n=1 Tax=Gossypium australe TaxID=47621 RepID=A0A5B6X4F9_9ROSI|nr:receptor-like protein kinase [Gossypium australe]